MQVQVLKPFGTPDRAWRRGQVTCLPGLSPDDVESLMAAGVVRAMPTHPEQLARLAAELGVGVLAPHRSEVAKACRKKGVRVITG